MADYTPHPEYEELPEAVKTGISEKDHAWLTDEQRAHLLEDFCTPDYLGE